MATAKKKKTTKASGKAADKATKASKSEVKKTSSVTGKKAHIKKSKKVVKSEPVKTTKSTKSTKSTKNVVKSVPAVKKTEKRKKPGRRGWIVGLVAILLVVIGVIGVVSLNQDKNESGNIENETSQSVSQGDVDVVLLVMGADGQDVKSTVNSNLQVNDYANYQVAANKPRYMSIPSIGVSKVPVIELGVTSSNQMESPKDPGLIGWYYRSALPGTSGTSVLNAHGGDLGVGIFKNLPRVAVGGEIVIEMGDGRKFTYTVVEKVYKNVGADANNYMKTAFTSAQSGVGGLTIITCTGDWIRASQTYSQRLFVRAILKQ